MTLHPPFDALHAELAPQSPLRDAITAATRRPEAQALAPLLDQARLAPDQARAAHDLAHRLADTLRQRKRAAGRAGIVQGLLQEFALSSQEGVALMCLAEALLRIPDAATRDALIRDKVGRGDWQAHLGQSPSLFVNAAAWGLLLTGKLVATHSEAGLGQSLKRLTAKGGEPLIRKGVDMAMRMMGEQFVTGETIEEALKHARGPESQGFRYSYDMLGEAALTADDAARYLASYEAAIHAIGRAAEGRGVIGGPGISIKLSALHPRYSRAQRARVLAELYPRVLQLAQLARQYDIGLNIDAEEADRLELSLDLLEKLCHEPSLAGWDGIGFVIQAYQKRCPFVIDWLVELARRTQHRLMVRLVKGAYWDSEIKRAQVDGQSDYPVYTRKPHTDVSYLACARKLLAAPEAIYPQFATHNAHSVAAIVQMAGPEGWQPGQYEFQCLHGMGEPLYEQIVSGQLGVQRPCRIYAPVGTHETLLAYLVRRLLENGANTSFVNRIADADVRIEELIEDPVVLVEGEQPVGAPHPRIPLPQALYGAERDNSRGMDLSDEHTLRSLSKSLQTVVETRRQTGDLTEKTAPDAFAGAIGGGEGSFQPVHNPADRRDIVGHVRNAGAADVERALAQATAFAPNWAATPPADRAAALQRAADALQADMPRLMGLLVREAGKTWANAIAEVREAVDFLRFYAAQVAAQFDNATHVPLGPVVCISPWNFPLAIFTGQVAAALAAGNVVVAKPAEQTPLIAAEAVRHLHQAGVPPAALQLLPGDGAAVGAALVADPRTRGVLFTGSTEVARLIQATLAERLNPDGQPVPLIAETGGQNALIVDSSALPEQVVQDVMQSAFDSAGQRCSALRVLCVQDDVAARVVTMLKGAMDEARIGNPAALSVDVGPVIDAEAHAGIQRHLDAMRAQGHAVHQATRGLAEAAAHGTFIPPTLIEIDRLDQLQREVFGPVLHVLRWRRADLDGLIEQINATGYGLTGGVHTRIDETIARVAARLAVGNLYVNRNLVGAVVGVQPFGGEGLSGTGPKAGGPLYLLRLLARQPADAAQRAVQALGETEDASQNGPQRLPEEREQLQKLLHTQMQSQGHPALADVVAPLFDSAPSPAPRGLPGPTGERNSYHLHPRRRVLCLVSRQAPTVGVRTALDARGGVADLAHTSSMGGDQRLATGADDGTAIPHLRLDATLAGRSEDRLLQLAAVLAVGAQAVWPADAQHDWARLPVELLAHIAITPDWRAPGADFDAVLLHGDAVDALAVQRALAARPGPIVGLTVRPPGATDLPLAPLLTERSTSVNTAAAGGNASLMTLDDDGRT
ncbi:trifunctional transcriptional regulator/proline dehydrogenase/L-glutamate gamma-semialdehyde dehydrogenase [Ottowia sp. SB7-C50]|uniref:trifunctional transcriptional regulator/proline dehydrogenase/L-glutamate gamma-semialdehyde dehydrogenase n=1 Tax=Ottowia sp. SB7-C50 TaxID=3081231 RepID=UPI0029541DCD|nr:trifunctional transcriptional regulator/proline dehydrogenase/L-glutamate gamma-semialdehyde dehydrogenase [Ottowia sp. SB7-C50]WOP15596.1 trifunctional transcriptional regulator/proline dehydrogenase/L-glutamate gamma-semialdehyde dehydrogenase [Ottowia sp. SB7-C50]